MHYYEIVDPYGNVIKCQTNDINRIKQEEKKFLKRMKPEKTAWCPDSKTRPKKLTDQQVNEIRASSLSNQQIADQYKISKTTVSKIKNFRMRT